VFPQVLGEPGSGVERLLGLVRSPESRKQIAAYGVEQVVAGEV
jgi:hypothetical protein